MLLDPDLLARAIASPVAAAILANQLDEAFVDATYVARGLWRARTRRISLEALRTVAPKRFAILLPAWKEAEVIERMLEHNLAAIDHPRDRFDFFCGTYQNDPATQDRVDAVAARFPNVHKVVVPHDGPTCKADCLNWVYQGVVLEERRRGARFDVLLMHDAEDVIHPLALRLYSLLLPRHEFVQTPVFSLELDPGDVVAGTYIDEFAEHHLKEMRVREAFGGLVPSAGVGSAFDRDAFEQIASAHAQQPFNVQSLTEDYEIGLKFRLARRRVHFACYAFEKPAEDGRPPREEYIATREFFPSALGASVRQRSRWILGITLQTWQQLGWKGSPAVLYSLWRDRKALVTNPLVLAAYALAIYVAARGAISAATGDTWSADRIIPPGTLLHTVLLLNLFAFFARTAVKMLFVRRLYGWAQAALSPARLLVANVIGVAATARAVRMYVRHRITGEPLRWLKTTHAFPSADVLGARAAAPAPRPAPLAPRPAPALRSAAHRVPSPSPHPNPVVTA